MEHKITRERGHQSRKIKNLRFLSLFPPSPRSSPFVFLSFSLLPDDKDDGRVLTYLMHILSHCSYISLARAQTHTLYPFVLLYSSSNTEQRCNSASIEQRMFKLIA